MMAFLIWRETPFSWPRFLGFLACLALVAVLSLMSGRSQAVLPPEGGPARESLRLGRPMAELYPELRQIGLPWFLRRAGSKAAISGDGASELAFDVELSGHKLGRYVERLERLDDDRTKIWISFEVSDAQAVASLAAPVKSRFSPADLLRTILKEHIRSELSGDGFDLSVLENTHAPLVSLFSRLISHARPCPPPRTDDFPLCGEDATAAKVRRAYIAAGLR
jgi:hypothetical protein